MKNLDLSNCGYWTLSSIHTLLQKTQLFNAVVFLTD